ncbi:MAG: PHP domain-containing protein, partial [Bacteroidota bacterium]
MFLIFDTETTGLPKRYDAPISDTENWPRCVQIAWQLHDDMGRLLEHKDYLVRPDGFNIPYESEQIHGISTTLAEEKGVPLEMVLQEFNAVLSKSQYVVGQNVDFDINVMGCELYRMDVASTLQDLPVLDTCTEHTAALCQIPGGRGGKFKLPTLTELHQYLFGTPFAEAHNATADVEATTRCFLELLRKRQFPQEELDVAPGYFDRFTEANPQEIPLIGLKHINLRQESKKIADALWAKDTGATTAIDVKQNLEDLADVDFVHLHNHSQFSVLQSTMSTKDLVQLAAAEGMPAVALTDHGNMMGAFHFVKEIKAHNKSVQVAKAENEAPADIAQEIKPIIGCEFFVCEDHSNKSVKDNGYQIVLLAKNKKGYQNLAKMASIAYTKGFYYVPRIDRAVIEQYQEDIIALSGNLYGEVPAKILNVGEKQAEEALLWWKGTFGDDFYLEIMRHGQEDEDRVNQVLVQFARKHDVKLVASNNTYYGTKADAEAHDILLCVKDGELVNTPVGRGRGYRYGLPNQEYYFKSSKAMKEAFKDLPEAIINLSEIVGKVEVYDLAREVLLPKFEIPETFLATLQKQDSAHQTGESEDSKGGENAYLRHITYEGAKERYGDLTPEIKERIDFELQTIANSGYPGYFLIVEDFIREARNMGVSVGPGRGSAAGSVVAYCLKITNIDPIKYDLLFERFLNP